MRERSLLSRARGSGGVASGGAVVTAASVARWSGRLTIAAGGALWIGRAAATDRHAHHAHQICLGLEGPMAVRAGTRWREYDDVLIPADVAHEIDGRGRLVALLFVEPESSAGRALNRAGCGVAPRTLEAATAQRLRATARGAAALEEMLCALAPHQPLRLDGRVEAALAILRGARGDVPPSAVVARQVGSSVGRFRHLFREQIGLSYRTYLLWLRLGAALEVVVAGASLTEAAHTAGFADSAHLSRTYRRMFGLTPTVLRRA